MISALVAEAARGALGSFNVLQTAHGAARRIPCWHCGGPFFFTGPRALLMTGYNAGPDETIRAAGRSGNGRLTGIFAAL